MAISSSVERGFVPGHFGTELLAGTQVTTERFPSERSGSFATIPVGFVLSAESDSPSAGWRVAAFSVRFQRLHLLADNRLLRLGQIENRQAVHVLDTGGSPRGPHDQLSNCLA